MRLVDRYIGRTIAGHTTVVMVVLLSLYFFSNFVADLGNVGQGHYTFVRSLTYNLMLLPRQAYELFPMVALMGTILGLGSLASSSELTVIRASGVSVRQLVVSVFKVGLVMVLLVGALGEGIAPPLEKYARVERAKALTETISVNDQQGLWAREGNTYVHVDRLLLGGIATGITLYRFNGSRRLEQVVTAARAKYADGGWRMFDVRRMNIAPDGITRTTAAEAPWSTNLTPRVIDLIAIPAENLSIWDLYGYIRFLHHNGLDARHYELALWVRIMAPLATAGMVLMAIPFVLGSLRSVGIGQRITVGGLLGIGFYLFNGIFSRIGLVYHMPPPLAASIPTAAVFLLWWLLMRRVV